MVELLLEYKESDEPAASVQVAAQVDKDILPIPVTTVASESAFSTSGRILSAHRTRLAPKTAEALMCMQAWSRANMFGNNPFISVMNNYELYFVFFDYLLTKCRITLL